MMSPTRTRRLIGAAGVSSESRSTGRNCSRPSVRHWKRKAECHAGVFVGGGPDPAAMRFDDRATDSKTHPHPRRFGREEWLKDHRDVLDADTTVTDLNQE